MTEFSAKEVFGRRLPLYAYLEPLLVGRRVLELGSGAGGPAAYLAAHGAAEVVGVEADAVAVARARTRHTASNLRFHVGANLLDLVPGAPFDVVLVPEAETLLRRPETIPSLGRLLAAGGRLVLVTTSADRTGGLPGTSGIGYYELTDALVPHFPAVQMFGVTPFAGFGVVEFDTEGEGLRVDSRLVDGGSELPTAYVAVAGAARAVELGYALVQVPFAPIEAKLVAASEDPVAAIEIEVTDKNDKVDEKTDVRADVKAAAAAKADPGRDGDLEARLEEAVRRRQVQLDEAEARVAELRRKLDDASVQAESAVRIARAQGEEMEELRARVRRAAEDRASLDAEAAKLRRALAEADESVMTLTRRTAEEMSAVAQRMAESLRAPERGGAREDAERLRVGLVEAESRAGAAERRLEEVATVGRERQAALDDMLERLRLAEESLARERAQVTRLQAELRAAGGRERALDDTDTAVARRDERIASLEGEKQELAWRLAELEEKLRQTIGRAVVADNTGRNQADELGAARAFRARALEEFHKAAGAHVDEVTALRSSVAEQSALVAELEDSLRVAEEAAATATAEAATLRKSSKGLEEADRTRRTRLAELEGKLLRLEHERKQATAAASAASSSSSGPDTEALDRRAADLQRERDELGRERDELRGNLSRLMGASAATAEALARATSELTTTRARASTLEAEVARLGAAKSAGGNGHDGSAATARELHAIEAGLREELESLTQIEGALAEELASTSSPARASEAGGGAEAVEQGAEAILLHATLGNYRRHAARLRDELEGIRRRLDSLSTSELSGYLEELGEDLAEMEE